MMRRSLFVFMIGFLFSALPASALVLDMPLADADDEARARQLFSEIRCVVCEAQSIADSPADVASDMRRLVREKISSGDSDDAIRRYLVAHYGQSVLMRPAMNSGSVLLWLGPPCVFLFGSVLAFCYFRRPVKGEPR